jgi:hypothetical protein
MGKKISGQQLNGAKFCDETKIMLFGNDGQPRIWRRKGDEFNPQCMILAVKHPDSVIPWGCMAESGVGRLQIVV